MRFLPDHKRAAVPLVGPVPDKYRRYLLPGASIRFTEMKAYSILSQEFRHKEYQIWSHRFFTRSPALIHPLSEKDLVTLHYMLKGGAKCYIQGFGALSLLPGRYQMYSLPANVPQNVWLEPGDCWSFHIGLPAALAKEIAMQYPPFAELLKDLKEHAQGAALSPLFRITRRIFSLIEEILDCREEKVKRSLYLCERISAMMNAYLEGLDADQRRQQWAASQTLKLHELENYIQDHLKDSIQALSVEKLAKVSGLSIRQFHAAVSILYGIHLDSLIHRIRMQKALELLMKENHSVAYITEQIGYTDPANFSRAFKKYYGKPPSSFRKT